MASYKLHRMFEVIRCTRNTRSSGKRVLVLPCATICRITLASGDYRAKPSNAGTGAMILKNSQDKSVNGQKVNEQLLWRTYVGITPPRTPDDVRENVRVRVKAVLSSRIFRQFLRKSYS